MDLPGHLDLRTNGSARSILCWSNKATALGMDKGKNEWTNWNSLLMWQPCLCDNHSLRTLRRTVFTMGIFQISICFAYGNRRLHTHKGIFVSSNFHWIIALIFNNFKNFNNCTTSCLAFWIFQRYSYYISFFNLEIKVKCKCWAITVYGIVHIHTGVSNLLTFFDKCFSINLYFFVVEKIFNFPGNKIYLKNLIQSMRAYGDIYKINILRN